MGGASRRRRARRPAAIRPPDTVAAPSDPPPLLVELAQGVRRRSFREELLRQAVMLTGVFAFGWSALEAAVFLLLEALLFLSFRAATEITIEPRFGVVAVTPAAFAWQFVLHLLAALAVLGLLIGAFGVFAVGAAFPPEAVAEFAREAPGDPWFLAGLAFLLGNVGWDTARFARRVSSGRSAAEALADDEELRARLAIAFCLCMASFWLGLAAQVGLGPEALAVALAVVVLYVEAAPHRATRMFRPPGPPSARPSAPMTVTPPATHPARSRSALPGRSQRRSRRP